MMTMARANWEGEYFSIRTKRHWNLFFDFVTVCEIKIQNRSALNYRPHVDILLPEGASHHILGIYELQFDAKKYFETPSAWWNFSKRLCDQYCDYYVMKRVVGKNTFATYYSQYSNERHAVHDFALNSDGYIGPQSWNL